MIFCRLSGQLVETMSHLASELMEEEKISCEGGKRFTLATSGRLCSRLQSAPDL